jgi:aminopeptidase N
MKIHITILFIIQSFLLFAGNSYIHHQVSVLIKPEQHYFKATDVVTIPAAQISESLQFSLLGDLDVTSSDDGVRIKLLEKSRHRRDVGMDQEAFNGSSLLLKQYVVQFQTPPQGDVILTLHFEGIVNFPIENSAEEYARSFSQTPGIICDKGAYLAGSTFWAPWFNKNFITFEMTVDLPKLYDVVSQGERTQHDIADDRRIVTWRCADPMEEIFLIAAPFSEYSYKAVSVDVMAFLRTPDENLANKYLQTTAQYLEMYRQLIGPYPFSKFALVENFWETGYGMPSFTLLGEQVIRFPFILHSSYPHELLHNYWGNSVYIDFETGNWCEGLTAYLADHLISEQRGQAAEYRRSTLQKFTDYVNSQNDFPLTEFTSRNSAASEAIGYGKCLMMWDMLREQVGDEIFVKALQKFYRDNKFKAASYDDIRRSFETASSQDLSAFFQQWTTRTGAPSLKLLNIDANKSAETWTLSFNLQQQGDAPFDLRVPAYIFFDDSVSAHTLELAEMKQNYKFNFSDEPRMIQIDPQFHIFRKLHFSETPPSLSKIYGAEEILVVLPSKASEQQKAIYRELADSWAADSNGKIEIVVDAEIKELPADKSIWILGLDNKFAHIFNSELNDYYTAFEDNTFRVKDVSFTAAKHSIIAVIRHPQNKQAVAVLLSTDRKEAISGLSRKLPHYGKYSYLVFEGDEPTNIAKGQWPIVNSPLVAKLSKGNSDLPEVPTRPALATLAPVFSADRMLEHVSYLADEKLTGRGLGSPGINLAADYIVQEFIKAGLQPGGDNGDYFQIWDEVINAQGEKAAVKNIIGVLPGKNPEFDDQSVVVCAHYDHLGLGWPDARQSNEGKIHPGADDNASGVAVLLELAKLLSKGGQPDRTLIFAAFTGEESGLLGSKHYVKTMGKYPINKIMGVLNLDTVGRLGDNKLLVLNSSSAREWKFIFMGVGYITGIEAELVAQELEASDQVSFIKAGVPGVQLFAGANMDYHRPTDTIDKIDAAGLIKVAAFAKEAINYLAEREGPMMFIGEQGNSTRRQPQGGESRSVTTGSMPDFAFTGDGVKLASISSDSPAQMAGLQKGDVIISIDDQKVNNLRDYSQALKKFKAGDSAKVVFLRQGVELTIEIKFIAR